MTIHYTESKGYKFIPFCNLTIAFRSLRGAESLLSAAFPIPIRLRIGIRPALVVSSAAFHKRYAMCRVAMITSAKNAALPSDIPFSTIKDTGLDVASVIRPAKIAILQVDKANRIGKVEDNVWKKALKFITQHLGS